VDGADLAGTADLGSLGLDEGGHLLVARALSGLRPGQRLAVAGTHPALRVHLTAWCRAHGHRAEQDLAPDGAGPSGDAATGPGPSSSARARSASAREPAATSNSTAASSASPRLASAR